MKILVCYAGFTRDPARDPPGATRLLHGHRCYAVTGPLTQAVVEQSVLPDLERALRTETLPRDYPGLVLDGKVILTSITRLDDDLPTPAEPPAPEEPPCPDRPSTP